MTSVPFSTKAATFAQKAISGTLIAFSFVGISMMGVKAVGILRRAYEQKQKSKQVRIERDAQF